MLSKLKTTALVIAVAGGIGLMWRLDGLGAELDQARQQQAEANAAFDIAAATLAVQMERNQRLVAALDERDEQLTDGKQRVSALRDQATALEADDADSDSRAWADRRVSSGVSRWVRDLTSPDDARANNPRAAVVPD